jgi:hypothetical protein
MRFFLLINTLLLVAALAAGTVIYFFAGRYFVRDVVFVAPMLNESRLHFTVEDIERLRFSFPDYTIVTESRSNALIEASVSSEMTTVIYTDTVYFNIHAMEFLDGGYWHTQEMSNGIMVNEILAWRLFGNTQAVGLVATVDGKPFTVVGVVRQGGAAESVNTAWIPQTAANAALPVTALYIQAYHYNTLNIAVDTQLMLAEHLRKNTDDYAIADINRYVEGIWVRNQILLCMVWACVLFIFIKSAIKYFIGKNWLAFGLFLGMCAVLCFFIVTGINGILSGLPHTAIGNINALPPEGYLSFGMRRLGQLNRYANYVGIAGAVALVNIFLGGRKWVK